MNTTFLVCAVVMASLLATGSAVNSTIDFEGGLPVECSEALKYTEWGLPNLLNHTDRLELFYSFWGFGVNTMTMAGDCSALLNFLLCSAYFPMSVDGKLYFACEPVCQTVFKECKTTLLRHGWYWPAFFETDDGEWKWCGRLDTDQPCTMPGGVSIEIVTLDQP